MAIPTVRPRIVQTRAARPGGYKSQNGALSARFRSYVDECPRCGDQHSVNGAVRNGLINAPCGLLEVQENG
ncbi:hypothetical protein Airi02_056960 [Actinoallomurus iriomotensis]|uniref:Uncharacterized protein n=1 Tax=Actinoallomurus iriomotensis TaxID=478107 RepID=A0A9W6S8L3_9ACTN|nr:hypothetical protein Airi02_056960 [Actinoallomurus iriomotensis]